MCPPPICRSDDFTSGSVCCSCVRLFVQGPTSSFYRPRRGSTNGGFFRKEPPSHGKTKCSTRCEVTHACGPQDHLVASYYLWRTTWTAWAPSTTIWAMATHDLRGLGLSAAHRVAPRQRFVYSGLVQLGHECVASRGAHEP
jgi:hypothetical protein